MKLALDHDLSVNVKVVGSKEKRNARGIHLINNFGSNEFTDALVNCEKDGFDTIWIHCDDFNQLSQFILDINHVL